MIFQAKYASVFRACHVLIVIHFIYLQFKNPEFLQDGGDELP